jgi:glycosyltransferase involved in cell wall biosynthesis
MPTLVMESWRFLPHSYAINNQYLCLELLKVPGLTLYHKDAPIPDARWKPAPGVMSEAQERVLREIPAPPEGLKADVAVRLSFPYDFSPSGAARTIVMGTSEYGIVPNNFVVGGGPISKVAKESGFLVATPSKWSREGFIRSGVKPGQMAYVPLGADTEVFRPLEEGARERLRERLGWSGRFVLLHASSLGWNKGVAEMIEGLAAVAGEFPQVLLVFKGLDAMYGSSRVLEQVAGQLPPEFREALARHIGYIGGSLTMEEMAELYQAADAYVCPYYAEGFNMPAMEAAACGTPVVCTAGGSTDDFMTGAFALKIASKIERDVKSGGMLLRPQLESYVAQLRRVMSDEGFRRQAREAGPKHMRTGWTWAHCTQQLLKVAGLA